MSKYKAIIIDLDGTLIAQSAKDGLPTRQVKQSLRQAREKIHIGIATGRPPIFAFHLLDHLNLSGPSIFLNGALILDAITKDILFAGEMNKNDFTKVITILLSMGVTFTIDAVNEYAMLYKASYMPQRPLVIFVRLLSEEKLEKVRKAISHIPTITAFQVPDWEDKSKWGLHICSITATKQHAIVKIAEILKISPREMIAVGDGYNDFPLLMACGLKVAMGNAVNDLKAIADYIAPSIEDDGVADVIRKFVLQ